MYQDCYRRVRNDVAECTGNGFLWVAVKLENWNIEFSTTMNLEKSHNFRTKPFLVIVSV
jgi:hypothetical protein